MQFNIKSEAWAAPAQLLFKRDPDLIIRGMPFFADIAIKDYKALNSSNPGYGSGELILLREKPLLFGLYSRRDNTYGALLAIIDNTAEILEQLAPQMDASWNTRLSNFCWASICKTVLAEVASKEQWQFAALHETVNSHRIKFEFKSKDGLTYETDIGQLSYGNLYMFLRTEAYKSLEAYTSPVT